jgi:hypothetical protein
MKTTSVGTKYGILVKFNPNKSTVSISSVVIDNNSNTSLFGRIIDADLIDVAEWDENIDIVVNDEGLLVEGNLVYDIKTPNGNIQLAGDLLFLKKEFQEDGIKLVGMDSGEALKMLIDLQGAIRVIGVTRGF